MNFSIAGFGISMPVIFLGLVTGVLYGVLGVGLVLVYRSSRIINFAYGDIGTFGAAVLAVATHRWGVPYWISFVLALAAAAGIGALSEILVMRRLKAAPVVLSVIATLGLGQVLTILATIISTTGGNGIGLGAQGLFPQPSGFPVFHVGALLMTRAYSAMLIVTPFIVAGLVLFLRRGRLGVAIRASAANPDAAHMSGMLAGRLSALAWGIAGALAAYTAILILPTRGFSSGELLGPDLLLRGLLCAVVARMVNLPVALVTGVALGVLEQLLLANYPNGGSVEMVMFVVILVVLMAQRATSGRGDEKGTWSAVAAFPPLPQSYRTIPGIRAAARIAAAIAAILLLVIPELTSNQNATIFGLIVVTGIVGLSIAVVTGLAGQLSLGQFAIAGVGAAGSYIVMRHGAPFLVGVAAAIVTGAVVSLLIGLPAIRIRGLMLAVATLGFALAADDWILEQKWMFGSGAVTRRPVIASFAFNTGKRYYLVAFAALLVAVWLTRNVWTSGLGRRLRAVRDNEDAARAFSVPTTTVKLQAFILSGVIAGLGGAVYGSLLSQQGAIAYPIDSSINATAASVIGGLGIVVGPLLGSLYIIGVPQFLPLDNAELAATAAGWLLLILRYPGGLAQAFTPLRDGVADAFARRAGLDPSVERSVTPGGGIGAVRSSLALPEPPSRGIPAGDVLLRAEGLTKRFGGLTAVNKVDLDVASGEILGLIGPNGAGKTTLFELLGGFTKPDTGRIWFGGAEITATKPEDRARLGLIRSFQDAGLFPTMTVHEVVMVALERTQPTRLIRAVMGASRPADRRKADRADELLAILGLTSYRDMKVATLSTGTRRIAELACLIALEPVLLLLDEPTSGIAQRESEALGGVLRNLKDQLDLTIVIIEHDIPLIMGLADRVVAMESGQVLTVGSPTEVQENPQVIASYLGGDIRAIERSARSVATTNGSASLEPDKCRAVTRSGAPCRRVAGADGVCAQHRKVDSPS
jgi:ABC-type branched-subunit amino acid transport system ATPase component/ABC-type branched-subunit amino acid transport system permease subunit